MALSVKEGLSDWYNEAHRDLPWKNTKDPYKIWLSEIILQQTRVDQGRPYYLRFVDAFPDVGSLARAPLDEVLKLWEGLGYYSRARNLHAAARQVVDEMDGRFPSDYASLIGLKGVGEYTAAAVASFAYDEPVAVVDGNVFRVLSRVFGIFTPIDSTEGKRKFREKAQEVLDREDPAAHNQAIMDLGALVCLPRKPLCSECPFERDCVARNEDRIEMLPVKSKAVQKRDRYFTFYILLDRQSVVIEQRHGKDIWRGLYQFPVIEHATGMHKEDPEPMPGDLFDRGEAPVRVLSVSGWYRQLLSHQRIRARFVHVEVDDLEKAVLRPGLRSVRKDAVGQYAFPRIIRSYMEENAVLS